MATPQEKAAPLEKALFSSRIGFLCDWLRMYESLDHHFTGHWIGRGGPNLWPPRSPVIAPCDYFLWGFIKNSVYKAKITPVRVLKQRISDKSVIKETGRDIRLYRLGFLL